LIKVYLNLDKALKKGLKKTGSLKFQMPLLGRKKEELWIEKTYIFISSF